MIRLSGIGISNRVIRCIMFIFTLISIFPLQSAPIAPDQPSSSWVLMDAGNAEFGKVVIIHKFCPVPPGWTVIETREDGNKIIKKNNTLEERVEMPLEDYGEKKWISVGAPIPEGWIIVDYKGEPNPSYLIENVRDEPKGTRRWVFQASPVPKGWVIIQIEKNGKKLIEKVEDAAESRIKQLISSLMNFEGDKIWIPTGSPIPKGWIIIDYKGEPNPLFLIEDVRKAPKGTKKKVLQVNPLPEGWIEIHVEKDGKKIIEKVSETLDIAGELNTLD